MRYMERAREALLRLLCLFESKLLLRQAATRVDTVRLFLLRPVPRVHVLNSFFYTKLVNGGYNYAGVRRWTKRVDVFQQDLILTPINLNNAHWQVAFIAYRFTSRVKFE